MAHKFARNIKRNASISSHVSVYVSKHVENTNFRIPEENFVNQITDGVWRVGIIVCSYV